MTKQKRTPRRVTRDAILVLIVLSIAVIAPVAYLAKQAAREVSEQFIHNASDAAVAEFKSMTQSIEASLELVRDWGNTGLLTALDSEQMKRLLLPLFNREPLLFGLSIADTESNSVYIQKEPSGFQSRRIDADKKQREATITYWNDALEETGSFTTNSIYDPRTRPWFAPALATESIIWTEPYKFYTAGEVGITASASYAGEKDNAQVVVAFDILLEELFNRMHGMAPSDNSQIFVFRNDSKLFTPASDNAEAGFLSLSHIEDPLIRKAHSIWAGTQHQEKNVASVLHEGAIWWVGFQPLEIERRSIWLGVMIPRSDIQDLASRYSRRLWFLGIGSLLAATAVAFWITRRTNRAFDRLASYDPENPVASVRKIIAGGENRSVEFKSTMRMNLHTKKPGKEIELAWLKGVTGFLNTDGGILLLGVTDAGEITGIEQDVFENEDKCRLHFKNLVNRHIGADLSKYIRFNLIPIEDKTAGVVLCSRSSEPVFLKDGDKEHFYIRNGPSSDELPVSKALRYIKHRT